MIESETEKSILRPNICCVSVICYLLSNWRKFCKEAFFKACTASTCHEAQQVLSHNTREAKEIESDLFQTSAIHQWDSFWEEAG